MPVKSPETRNRSDKNIATYRHTGLASKANDEPDNGLPLRSPLRSPSLAPWIPDRDLPTPVGSDLSPPIGKHDCATAR